MLQDYFLDLQECYLSQDTENCDNIEKLQLSSQDKKSHFDQNIIKDGRDGVTDLDSLNFHHVVATATSTPFKNYRGVNLSPIE